VIDPVKWPYKTPTEVIIPFSIDNPFFTEDFLGRLYFRIKEEGMLDLVCSGMNIVHMNGFINYLSGVRGLVICCLQGPGYPVPHPVGFGWLNEIGGTDGARTGSFSFGYFKEFRRRRAHIVLSNFMLAFWFQRFKIDRLFATTKNPLALNYSKRFGFEYLCEVPEFFSVRGKLEPAHFITLASAKFLPYYEAWLGKRRNP
jgi:hypothetical protein